MVSEDWIQLLNNWLRTQEDPKTQLLLNLTHWPPCPSYEFYDRHHRPQDTLQYRKPYKESNYLLRICTQKSERRIVHSVVGITKIKWKGWKKSKRWRLSTVVEESQGINVIKGLVRRRKVPCRSQLTRGFYFYSGTKRRRGSRSNHLLWSRSSRMSISYG